MNLIVLCIDSLRQDHVGAYHRGERVFPAIPACQTPNLDAFAAGAVAFRNAHPSNLPTIPIRAELMTGNCLLPSRIWEPLHATDLPMAEILRREGFICGLISDTYHYRAPGMNYHRGFHAYEWIRGQEYDPYNSAPTGRRLEDYVTPAYSPVWRGRVGQYLANTDDFRRDRPREWFAGQVADRAVHWLEKNRKHKNLFLWVDSFDPHEPWDPPTPYDTYRPENYIGPRLIMPMGGQARSWASAEQIEQIRGLYAGEVASVDGSFGPFFEALERLAYYEDSIVLVLADHGHPLGDHGKFLKGGDRLYSELLNVPFLLRTPGNQSDRVSNAIVAYPDVLPTLLDLLGFPGYAQTMTGRSFRGVIEGETDSHRQVVVSGYHGAPDRCVRDAEWSFIRRPEGEPDELYHLVSDPHEQRNVIDDHPDQVRRLLEAVGPHFFHRPIHQVKGLQGRWELGSANIE